MNEIEEIRNKLRKFADERDWNQFHSPKNLAIALSVEVSEVLEILQWLTEEQSRNLSEETLVELADELGDVHGYLIRLADKLNIDLVKATNNKIDKNVEKYPADKVRGSSKKYSDYSE